MPLNQTTPSGPLTGPVTIADGADVALGATTAAAVDTDTTGTVSGKLRGLVKLFVNLLSRIPAALGQATMAASTPVAIASNQSAVPISAASLPLPTGAATLAGQTQPGVDIGDVTVNNAAGASAVNIQDGGNSITVDGVFFQATQPISATSLPLPANAAREGGGNLDAISLNTGGSLVDLDGILANTTPMIVSGAGIYVQQDSTASIAKETGGNLDRLALAQGTSGTDTRGPMMQGLIANVPPGYLDNTLHPLSVTNDGCLRVSILPARLEIQFFNPDEEAMWDDLISVHEAQSSAPWAEW